MTKSYQISKDMDIETMPHTMYFTADLCRGFNHSPKHCYKGEHDINNIMEKMSINPHHVPYKTIVYNDNGVCTAKLMNDTPIKIFIDNGATPSILPLHTYNKFPILHTYPKTESNTPIHTGGGFNSNQSISV